jgi:hypothetical protein
VRGTATVSWIGLVTYYLLYGIATDGLASGMSVVAPLALTFCALVAVAVAQSRARRSERRALERRAALLHDLLEREGIVRAAAPPIGNEAGPTVH